MVKRLQRRVSKFQHAGRDPGSGSAETAWSIDGSQGGGRDQEVWATEDPGLQASAEDEAGVLKANASMMGGWETRTSPTSVMVLTFSGVQQAGAGIRCTEREDDHPSHEGERVRGGTELTTDLLLLAYVDVEALQILMRDPPNVVEYGSHCVVYRPVFIRECILRPLAAAPR